MKEPLRIGYGYDVHRFAGGRRLVLGGVEIDHDRGLAGHSDADVLIHAICDAFLGALALGDIGTHYPDSSGEFRDMDSRKFLSGVAQMVRERGYRLANLDCTVVAEQPRLAPHIPRMRKVIADELETEPERISVKATTSEGIGFEGDEEGISARAVVLLRSDSQ